MKAALYIRCSTSQQDVENQRLALERWASERGFEIVATYRENESAWREGHQRELSRLRWDARRRKFDIVLVWALDRLSREGPLKVLQLVQSLQLRGVKLMSYQEAWTWMDGPMSEVLYAITAWVAKYESERRSERTKAGMIRKAREYPDGRIPPRGKDKHKRKRRTPRAPIYEGD